VKLLLGKVETIGAAKVKAAVVLGVSAATIGAAVWKLWQLLPAIGALTMESPWGTRSELPEHEVIGRPL